MKKGARLIRFPTPDGLMLPGLLYEAQRRTKRAAIFLHGNGGASVFYSAVRTQSLGEELARRGIAFFPFNNRGAHLITRLTRRRGTRTSSVNLGMAHELIRECVQDIDGAVAFLRQEGYADITLIGHSTGANKICVYNRLSKRNGIRRYVMLGGGDDTGLYYQQVGARRFDRMLEQCRVRIREGRGAELVPSSVSPVPLSYRSLYDTINPDGDYNVFPFLEAFEGIELSRRALFRDFSAIRKPSLVLYGENDEYCYGRVDECVEVLRSSVRARRNFTFGILRDTDHGFHGKERELGRVMANWMNRSQLK